MPFLDNASALSLATFAGSPEFSASILSNSVLISSPLVSKTSLASLAFSTSTDSLEENS